MLLCMGATGTSVARTQRRARWRAGGIIAAGLGIAMLAGCTSAAPDGSTASDVTDTVASSSPTATGASASPDATASATPGEPTPASQAREDATSGSEDTNSGSTETAPPQGATETTAPPPPPDPAPTTYDVNVTLENFDITFSAGTFKPGIYRFHVTSSGGSHDFLIAGASISTAGTPLLGLNESATVEVTLNPGTFTIWCSVGNHRALGMETTISVS